MIDNRSYPLPFGGMLFAPRVMTREELDKFRSGLETPEND